MAMIQPDFTQTGSAFVRIEPGIYTVRVVQCEEKLSQAGNPYLNWKLSIFGADDIRYNGKWVFYRTPIKGKGAFRLSQILSVILPDYKPGDAFDSESTVGKSLSVKLIYVRNPDGSESPYPSVDAVFKVKTAESEIDFAGFEP